MLLYLFLVVVIVLLIIKIAINILIYVFERITEDDFNSNVTLGVCYMLGMGKDVLLLKDKTLKELTTDLTGKIYKSFDTDNIEEKILTNIEKWVIDKGLVNK